MDRGGIVEFYDQKLREMHKQLKFGGKEKRREHLLPQVTSYEERSEKEKRKPNEAFTKSF